MNKIIINDKNEGNHRIKEIFRTLRTNIEFTGVENRVIAITSCSPNDGKTTISFQLAKALTDIGHKTLLIDADMRKSVLLNRIEADGGEKGLSHFLSGQDGVDEIIYATDIPDLYIIPTGVFPVNPTELLGNNRFQQLLTALKRTFQYIIVDTPPIGSVIDAAVIAKYCDGSILVLASDKVSKAEAKQATEQMRMANENILGVILNKVEIYRGSYYGKYYKGYYRDDKFSK